MAYETSPKAEPERRHRNLLGLVAAALILAAVAFAGGGLMLPSIFSRPTPSPVPTPLRLAAFDLKPAIDRGVVFLHGQYSDTIGLLQESPNIGKHNFYLTNDNALAAYTFESLGVEPALAARLRASLKHYGFDSNGFVEVAWGKSIRWPPQHHKDLTVSQVATTANILQETHPFTQTGRDNFYDWSAFSNLAFMAVVNECNQGHYESATRLFEIQMSSFDGVGWADKAWADRGGMYETIGLAWGLYAATMVGGEDLQKYGPQLVTALLQKQSPETGGFHTHYRQATERLADPNVETTSLALLALDGYLRKSR